MDIISWNGKGRIDTNTSNGIENVSDVKVRPKQLVNYTVVIQLECALDEEKYIAMYKVMSEQMKHNDLIILQPYMKILSAVEIL